jgi:penicillin-binding protein 1A
VWRFDRDGKKPQQVISPEVALDMIKMMNSVVENGTGKRAQLDGIKVAGKTGTTNSWRDAWFVGYTGNFVGAVWMGNDDYTSTKRMTGGTLPAMTWHNIMAYAHQGIELRPLPGLPGPEHAPTITETSFKGSQEPHPILLTRKGTDALVRVEHLLDDADRALTSQAAPAGSLGAVDGGKDGAVKQAGTFAATAERESAATPRGD